MKNIWCKRRYRGENPISTSSPRVLIKSDNKDNERATIKIFGHHREIKLVNLRMVLVFLNLVVLAASFVSYLAWMDAKYNWQLVNTDRPDRRILAAIEYLPALSPSSLKIVASVHGHLDQLLYLTAFNMFLWWVIYGFVISCRFGGTCDICTIVVSLPHSIIMIVWEIGIASAILRVNTIFSSLPWNYMSLEQSQHYKDLRYVHDFYSTWGPWIVTLYFLSVPVQIFLISLPFLLSRLPFQEKYQQSLEMTNQAEPAICTESRIENNEGTEIGTQVKKKGTSFVNLLSFRPGTARLNRQGDLSNYGGERKGLNHSYKSPTTKPQSSLSGERRQNECCIENINESQKPGLVDLGSMKSYKQIASQQYNCAYKAISAGKAVIETMGRTYHVHNSSRPLWNLLDKPVTPHYRLAGRDYLAGGVSIYENHPPRNYLNMASPPPPYSLHPRAEYVNLEVTKQNEEFIREENKDKNDSYVSIDLHHQDDICHQLDLDYQEKKEDGCRNHHRNLVNCTNPHCSQHEYDEQLEELASQQDWSETSIII